MLENYKAVLPKSTIGQALHYSLERWDKLTLYTTNGKLEIDNNLVENAIRPVAIGRKNYLFAGSHITEPGALQCSIHSSAPAK